MIDTLILASTKVKTEDLRTRLATLVYIVLAIFDVFFQRKKTELNKSKGLLPFADKELKNVFIHILRE